MKIIKTVYSQTGEVVFSGTFDSIKEADEAIACLGIRCTPDDHPSDLQRAVRRKVALSHMSREAAREAVAKAMGCDSWFGAMELARWNAAHPPRISIMGELKTKPGVKECLSSLGGDASFVELPWEPEPEVIELNTHRR